VGIDAPDFNLGLERRLKRHGIPTVHGVSPSVWAWRRERVTTIGQAVDRMLTLFPFEKALYEDAGIRVDFIGHPLARDAATPQSRRRTRDTLKLKPATPVFALLPGSRLSEIEMHAALLIAAARLIVEARPDAQFLVPLVSRGTREAFERAMYAAAAEALPVTLLYGHADDALQAADVALVASGTATLEAALARCPHVIFYRVSPLTARIVARKLLLPYVGLPNVLAGRFVVPELLQDAATSVNLAQAALNLFDDSVTRRRMDTVFAGFAAELAADTGALAAAAVLDELALRGGRC
jgi:lipid-A-disaccharide synthase